MAQPPSSPQSPQQMNQMTVAAINLAALGMSSMDPRKYKTKMCRNWVKTGTCSYHTSCCFAHSETELREPATNISALISLGMNNNQTTGQQAAPTATTPTQQVVGTGSAPGSPVMLSPTNSTGSQGAQPVIMMMNGSTGMAVPMMQVNQPNMVVPVSVPQQPNLAQSPGGVGLMPTPGTPQQPQPVQMVGGNMMMLANPTTPPRVPGADGGSSIPTTPILNPVAPAVQGQQMVTVFLNDPATGAATQQQMPLQMAQQMAQQQGAQMVATQQPGGGPPPSAAPAAAQPVQFGGFSGGSANTTPISTPQKQWTPSTPQQNSDASELSNKLQALAATSPGGDTSNLTVDLDGLPKAEEGKFSQFSFSVLDSDYQKPDAAAGPGDAKDDALASTATGSAQGSGQASEKGDDSPTETPPN